MLSAKYFLAALLVSTSAFGGEIKAELISSKRIWDTAPHNAFTDMVHAHGRWFCVFREGKDHVSNDGALRVIESADGDHWASAALVTLPGLDLRDPKITTTPRGELMMTGAAAKREIKPVRHQTMAWFSADGKEWAKPVEIGDPDVWLWRVTWHKGAAYSVGYDTMGEKFVRLYQSPDGKNFQTLVSRLHDQESPNETGLVFLPNDTAVCLLRRDGNPGHGLLGTASPPYKDWAWKDLGRKIGGPNLIRTPGGDLVGAVRLYDQKVRTSLIAVDLESGKSSELLALPSGGDCSYPGLVLADGLLWISYYSSHEGKTSIYLAKARLSR